MDVHWSMGVRRSPGIRMDVHCTIEQWIKKDVFWLLFSSDLGNTTNAKIDIFCFNFRGSGNCSPAVTINMSFDLPRKTKEHCVRQLVPVTSAAISNVFQNPRIIWPHRAYPFHI